MRRRALVTLLVAVIILILAEFAFLAFVSRGYNRVAAPAAPFAPETAAVPETTAAATAETMPETQTLAVSVPETEPETSPETVPETEAAPETQMPTEPAPETEPEDTQDPNRFVLTFVGDCTLGGDPVHYSLPSGFIKTIGEDYDYPFRNVLTYFENDDFTFANLEGVLADSASGQNSSSTFTFRGPTAYTQILTGSSVEAVTLANNHTMDYDKVGYASTKEALENAGVTYVEKNNSAIYTTDRGLKIGMYGAAFTLNGADLRSRIAQMRAQGADIIIAAIHWGEEGSYHPNNGQVSTAHAMIDAGVDIVYGSHSHVLQPIEQYKNGIIFYSMANFCFGGNAWPSDMDSVVLQQEIIRDANGKCRLGELTRIPVSCSSMPYQNNFQPTPYKEDSADYRRTMSKLDGTWQGEDLIVSYNDAP